MKTLQELDLHVPHLGVKQTCQTIGGYGGYSGWGGWGYHWTITPAYCHDYWDDSDYDLNPAYCVDAYNRSSGWENSLIWSLPDIYDYSGYNNECDERGGGPGGSAGDGDDFSVFDDSYGENGYYMDPYMSANDAKIIYAAMEDLPEALQNQEVKIVVDPDLLASFSTGVNGCFLRKGATYTTLNGEKITITEDTILLKSAEVAEQALIEESVHQWATNNGCRLNGTNNGNIDYMDRQADIIEAIHLREKGIDWQAIPGAVPKDKEIMDYIDKFIENHKLNDLIDNLENSNKLRNSDTWDYKWEELLKDCYPQYDCADESLDTSSWLDFDDKFDHPIDNHVNGFRGNSGDGDRFLVRAAR